MEGLGGRVPEPWIALEAPHPRPRIARYSANSPSCVTMTINNITNRTEANLALHLSASGLGQGLRFASRLSGCVDDM